MIDEGLVDQDGDWRRLADFDPDLTSLPIVQYYPADMLGSDPTSQWAPNRVALEGWLRGSGFEPLSTWQHAFRGGAVGPQDASSSRRASARSTRPPAGT